MKNNWERGNKGRRGLTIMFPGGRQVRKNTKKDRKKKKKGRKGSTHFLHDARKENTLITRKTSILEKD